MLQWSLENGADQTRVTIDGKLDQEANLDRLRDQLHGQVIIDLSGVHSINSCGVREWIGFVRALDSKGCNLVLERCSVHVVDKLNLVINFRGTSKIRSIYAPYICEPCFFESYLLVDLEGDWDSQIDHNAPHCAKCGQEMEFDHIKDEYFAFIELID